MSSSPSDTKLTGEERQKIAGKLLSLMELWEPGTMLKDVMMVPHPNLCNSDTFWPVSPNNLQLERPSLATFVTNRSFLLWEVNTQPQNRFHCTNYS